MTDDVITQLGRCPHESFHYHGSRCRRCGRQCRESHVEPGGSRAWTLWSATPTSRRSTRVPWELKVRLGSEGLGAGNDPENGRKAAIESLDVVRQRFEASGTKMVFITAGMGGGGGYGRFAGDRQAGQGDGNADRRHRHFAAGRRR